MSGMHRFWSTYADESCRGVPTGVFIQKLNDCVAQVASSGSKCAAKYDGNQLIGYVNESCHEGRSEGLDDLYKGEPYMGYDYYWDGSCTDYENSASYRFSGDCENLYDNDTPGRSATITISNGLLVWTRNMGAVDCPGVNGPNHYQFIIPVADVVQQVCNNVTGMGGFKFYNTSTALPLSDTSGSDLDNSKSAMSDSSWSSSTSRSSSSSNLGWIVGIAVGGVVIFIAITILGWCFWKRCKRSEEPNTQSLQDPFIARGSRWTGGTGGSTAGSDLSTFGPGLWTDDTIVAARIPRDQIIVEALISRGGFGEIYRGKYNRQDIAIKMLFPEVRSDLKKVNSFLAEAKLMAGLMHPHIVRFVGVSWGSLSDLCVLTELMKGGDLRALLKNFEAQGRPQGIDEDKLHIAYHIAQALTYLHSLSPIVIHRDLKSNNVLLTENLDAKLADFGVSRERELQTMTAGVGTMLWMAPEIMMGERYDEKADVFSFGVLLSELDQQSLPYAHARTDSVTGMKVADAMILQKVTSGALQVAFSAGCLAAVVQLGKECVALDSAARPSSPMVVYRLQTIIRESFGG